MKPAQSVYSSLHLFLTAHGAASFALGVHQVLLAWLSIGVVGLSAAQVGWVQAAGLLPNIVLMLLAGVWADSGKPARIMAIAQMALFAAYALLAILVWKQALTYTWLLIYAALVGGGNAFMQPIREKVIGELSRHSLQVKITRASVVQFSLQSCGVLCASLSEYTGILMVCLVQMLVTSLAAGSLLSLHCRLGNLLASSKGKSTAKGLLADFQEGVAKAAGHSGLRQLILLVGFNGFMHMGLFLVAIPLLARDVYGFNTVQYGFLQFSFVAGMLIAYITIMRKPVLQFPGRGAMFSLLYTAIAGYGLSRQPTFNGLYILLVFWGWIAGYSSTHCRMVLQIFAEPEKKGRLVSLYQVALFGMAPLGALSSGYVISIISPPMLFMTMSLASVLVFLLLVAGGRLWKVEQEAGGQ